LPLEVPEEARQVCEVDLDAVARAVRVANVLELLVAPRPDGRSILAGHFGRHALADLALRLRVHEQDEIGVRMDVDEPGRECQALEIELLGCRRREPRADRRNAVPGHRDVHLDRRGATAVVDRGAAEHPVGALRSREPARLEGPTGDTRHRRSGRERRSPLQELTA